MYKKADNGVIRIRDNAFIPEDNHNRDWREYLTWAGKGNAPAPRFTERELVDRAMDAKRQEVLTEFDRDSREPIPAAGTLFPGGEEAMMELDREIRFARLLEKEECEVTDVDGIERIVPVAEAEELLKTIVAGWKSMVKEKRARLFDLGRAGTLEEVEDIPGRGFKDIISGRTEEGRK